MPKEKKKSEKPVVSLAFIYTLRWLTKSALSILREEFSLPRKSSKVSCKEKSPLTRLLNHPSLTFGRGNGTPVGGGSAAAISRKSSVRSVIAAAASGGAAARARETRVYASYR